MPVNNRLGESRRSRGKQNPQRMVECHLLACKIRRSNPRLIHQLVPAPHIARGHCLLAFCGVRHVNRMLDSIQPFQDVAQFGFAVVVLPAILVSIDVKKDLGRKLPEALQHALGAEVGAAAAPDGANAGAGQGCDSSLRCIGQHRRDAITGPNAHSAHLRRQDAHLIAERSPAHPPQRLALAHADDGRRLGTLARENMARIVEPRPREPLRARHAPPPQHRVERRRRLNAKIIPDRVPERFQISDRPVPQGIVAFQAKSSMLFQPLHETQHM